MSETSESVVLRLAHECGFELAGITAAVPVQPDAAQFLDWVSRGLAGRMEYLTDNRAAIRCDPRLLLPSARSIICAGRLYNQPGSGPIARYARGEDYHVSMRRDLERMTKLLTSVYGSFDYKICVDTAPLLERSCAQLAGLGWIGRNTCLINQQFGSYLFLAEILVSLPLVSNAAGRAADRCGTCTRCIDACPTDALVPGGQRTELDATRCISYLTIELKGEIPEALRPGLGTLAFGCDICQEVCPWNRKAPFAAPSNFPFPADLESLAEMSPEEFRTAFRGTAVWRTKYRGLLRNVAVALGNTGEERYRGALERLAGCEDEVVRDHAEWALHRIDQEIVA